MRRLRLLIMTLILMTAALLPPIGHAQALAGDECTVEPDARATVQVIYPALSPRRNLDFWRIPWAPGDKIDGSLQVLTTEPTRNLTIRMVGGATSLDPTSRRVIPGKHLVFRRSQSDAVTETTAPSQAALPPEILPPDTYLFDFQADQIPGEDTYCARLEAYGEHLDGTNWQPFTVKLPSIKLKALSDVTVRVTSGHQLSGQWLNADPPLRLLQPLERLLQYDEETYFSQHNPEPTVAVTMPGRVHVSTTQQFQVEVTLDPVLNDDSNPIPWVHFWIEGHGQEQRPRTVPGTVQLFEALGNETIKIHIYRAFSVDPTTGIVSALRIPPGKYQTNLHIRTEWGTNQVLPVELKVRDSSLWPMLTLIVGILVSLLAQYWQTRQPLFRAQTRSRRWRRFYLYQGIKLNVAEWAIARLNACVIAGDVDGTDKAADFLADLMMNPAGTLVTEAALCELQEMPQVNPAMLWAQLVGVTKQAGALDRLREFCQNHPDPAVQEYVGHLADNNWAGRVQPLPLDTLTPLRFLQHRLYTWLGGKFLDVRRITTRLLTPSAWDTLAMLVLFLLVNGGVVALQMVQVYAPNATFGTTGDYMNLLLWGFAGDTTRKKLMDLAGQMLPADGTLKGRIPGGSGDGTPTPPV